MCFGWDARYSSKSIGEDKFALAGTQGTVQKHQNCKRSDASNFQSYPCHRKM